VVKMSASVWDYIIIGAGSAGCVLANRLTEDPDCTVLLLEAGPSDWNPLIQIPGALGRLNGPGLNWRFHTVPQKHLNNRRIWFPQGRVLGGSSAINAMIYARGQKADYDDWAAMGNDGWSYEDVLPYFKKSERNSRSADHFHASNGPLRVSDQSDLHPISRAFIDATRQHGLPANPDFNGKTALGSGFYQVTCHEGRRQSTARAFLRSARDRPNLVVRTNARVLSVKTTKARVTGVEIADGRSSELLAARREVILSAGAINSPRLLMLSGIGDADELSAVGITPVHHLPGVGKNLQDHLNINVHLQTNGANSYDGRGQFPIALIHGLRWLLLRSGPAAATIVQGGGFHASDGGDRPDLQIHVAPATIVRGGQTKITGSGFTVNSAFLRPRSRGTVRLKSHDPRVDPLIDPNYLSDSYDRNMVAVAIRKIRAILSQPAIASLVAHERLPGATAQSDADLLAYAREYACTDYHPVGTCRMGLGEDAVVGPNLKLHGLDGLRVIDASIMPRLTSGNTNAPTIMIAEKGADLVLGQENRRPMPNEAFAGERTKASDPA